VSRLFVHPLVARRTNPEGGNAPATILRLKWICATIGLGGASSGDAFGVRRCIHGMWSLNIFVSDRGFVIQVPVTGLLSSQPTSIWYLVLTQPIYNTSTMVLPICVARLPQNRPSQSKPVPSGGFVVGHRLLLRHGQPACWGFCDTLNCGEVRAFLGSVPTLFSPARSSRLL
jgi:hypothetical protein